MTFPLRLDAAEPVRFENDLLRLRLIPRSPAQMAGFYEARGFPAPMIDELKRACFITVGIHNKSNDILWLDLGNWQFSLDGQPIRRIHRNEWKARWQNMGVPLASQSTFRWTLLPEQLDFHPGEREGGNITLQRVSGELTLDAHFERGARRQAVPLRVQVKGLQCAKDKP
ncbi:MAG: hypothetical protein PVF75_01385 [Granulosicoccaceae bacterium]